MNIIFKKCRLFMFFIPLVIIVSGCREPGLGQTALKKKFNKILSEKKFILISKIKDGVREAAKNFF